jgi:hypothetical protein
VIALSIRRGIGVLLLGAALLTSCRGGESSGGLLGGGSGSELEEAAIERGVIVDAESSDPTGLYERNHTSGSDGFCLTPGDGSDFRFAATISFGTDLFCEGQGMAERDGSKLRLSFEGAPGCSMDAEYEGDAIKLGGTMPEACRPLCSQRGSFAGAEMRRVGWTAADAARLASKRDVAGKLCAKPVLE